KVWLAWMGNWTYARDVPTRPWKGNQSIPRTLQLIKGQHGYQLIQKPIEELNTLRTQEYSIMSQTVNGTQELTEFQPEWNVYELEVAFKIDSRDQVFGVVLAQSEENGGIKITYNAHTSVLEVDRSGTPFSFAYKRISKAPVHFPKDSILNLHIYVDQASVEVFANGYETSISSLAFTDVLSTGISLFCQNDPVKLLAFNAWDLESIWGVTPDEVDRPEEPEVLQINQPQYSLYPNPIQNDGILTLSNRDIDWIVLRDMGGKEFQLKVEESGSVKLPDMAAGLYLVRFVKANEVFTEKLIIK
ncbi:MAG: GH32 C-terminal domain-containing protein, partial [Marinoscillum sp.]